MSPEAQTITALIVAAIASLGWVRTPSPDKTNALAAAISRLWHKPSYRERIEACGQIINQQHALIEAIKAEAAAEQDRIEQELRELKEVQL